ncbi:MAG TPA: S9 family peptidase [Candidatus Saccharimonadales bacterium]|nr:S9 family peptidase [Candidatus Saccharimonadales bacterium]
MVDELLTRLLGARSSVIADVAPDGAELLVRCDDTGSMQVYRLPAMGGDLVQLTFLDEPVSAARYIPGTGDIVVAVDRGGNESYQLWLVSLQGDEPRPLVVEEHVKHDLGDVSRDGRLIAFSSTKRNGVDIDVHVLDRADGSIRTVFEGGWNRVECFSPDGHWLTVVRLDGSFAISDDLLLVDLETGEVRIVVERTGAGTAVAPTWYPDSSAFLFSTDAGRDVASIARYDVGTSSWHYVLDTAWDSEASLSTDGRRALVFHAENAITRLQLHDGETLAHIRNLRLPEAGTGFGLPLMPRPLLSSNGTTALLTYTTTATPLTPLRVDTNDSEPPVQLLPIDQVVSPALVTPELQKIESFDGEQITYFLYKPEVDNPPVVVVVHGGPEARFAPRYDPFIIRLVAQGIAVVAPNVRGSAGWGRRFVSLDDRRLRLDSVRDLTAVHASLAERGVDATRVAVIGGSYGGYMTLAALAFHPDLWAAGIATVGISSLVTFLENTSPYRRRVREVEYGFLDTDRDFLIEASPMTHVDRIRAPLMLIHGANDPRVPVGEARQLHASLRARGVASELLIYEDEGHGLAKRANRLDAAPRMLAFLRKNLDA